MLQMILIMETEGAAFHSKATGWTLEGAQRTAPYSFDTPRHAMRHHWRLMCPPIESGGGLWVWWFEKSASVHSDDLPGERKCTCLGLQADGPNVDCPIHGR